MRATWTQQAGFETDGFQGCVLRDGQTVLIWCKGYFFNSGGRLRVDEEIGHWLGDQLSEHKFASLVPVMNGCFVVAAAWPREGLLEVGVDRFGAIPVYYSLSDKGFALSNDFWWVSECLESKQYNRSAVLSMVLLSYVTGYDTLLEGVRELAPATIHRFTWRVGKADLTTQRYWRLSYRSPDQCEVVEWRRRATEVFSSVFRRHAEAIRSCGWEVQVPLSGGKDSRLIVGMFHRNGVPLKAFSYGSQSSTEVDCARRVANALSIPFRFVEVQEPSFLTPSLIQAMTRLVGVRTRFTAGLGAFVSLKAFEKRAVYTLSHPANLVTGGDLSRGALLVRSRAQAVRHLRDSHMLPILDDVLKDVYPEYSGEECRREVVERDWSYDPDDPTGSIDHWDFENPYRKKILSETIVYERFGRWMLPFSDYDLSDFFTQVPLPLRYRDSLYIEALLRHIFVDDLAVLSEIPIAFKGPLQPVKLEWQDCLFMMPAAGIFADFILRRGSHTKYREHVASIGQRSPEPLPPDPLDHWWYDDVAFRHSILSMFEGWDGLHGMIYVPGLMRHLERPLPRLFVQFGIPALLTLRTFQALVEGEAQQ